MDFEVGSEYTSPESEFSEAHAISLGGVAAAFAADLDSPFSGDLQSGYSPSTTEEIDEALCPFVTGDGLDRRPLESPLSDDTFGLVPETDTAEPNRRLLPSKTERRTCCPAQMELINDYYSKNKYPKPAELEVFLHDVNKFEPQRTLKQVCEWSFWSHVHVLTPRAVASQDF
jgi:hypothetical protein